MEEPLELPILNDLTMVLGSISQVLILNDNNFICHFVCFKSQKIVILLLICSQRKQELLLILPNLLKYMRT